MKLLQLTSNNPKFRTLNFKPSLNMIVGSQLTAEQKKSINGIGKSMSLTLIHYILGSSFKSDADKKLKEYLAGYGEFQLSLLHKSKEYNIKKDFSKPEFYINDEKITPKKYPEKLTELFLNSNHPIGFRQIFNCFARRYSSEVSYYSNVLAQQARPLEDYSQRLTNLFLLGIDTSLVHKNNKIKENLSTLKKAEDAIREYEKALDKTNINDLKDEIKRLTEALDSFIIAENYDQFKKEADQLTEHLNELRNIIYFTTKKLRLKESNFNNSENINIDTQKIEELYKEANFFFEKYITKRLEEAQEFHNNLINNRKKRLEIEIKDLNIELDKLTLQMKQTSEKRDNILKDLNNVGALEEWNSIKDRVKTLEAEKKDLEKYEHILSDFKKEKSGLEVQEAIVKQESISYLEKQHAAFDKLEENFRDLVKQFYDNEGGRFKITEAPNARYLFNINSHIPKEGSQGVGEVKIFCYDVLLYLLNKNLLNFLAHDGCIFSEMDKRQKSTIFKIIVRLVKENELQYFLNIGDSTLNEVLEHQNEINILDKEDIHFISQSKILELHDKEPKHWLFGESFN